MSIAQVNVLILEDDEGLQAQYRWLLDDYRVFPARNRAEAKEIVRNERPALAVVDLGLPPDPDGIAEGVAAVVDILQLNPATKVIVVTGNESLDGANRAVAAGAYDFFQKPADPDLLKLILGRAARLCELEQETPRRAASVHHTPVTRILGNSEPMQKVLRNLERLAKTDITVLIP